VTSRAAEQFAPAKINLTLRIGRKRPDGYHDLESLVVFADIGDTLRIAPGEALGLSVEGPTATDSGPPESNLVLKVARATQARIPGLQMGHFYLTKAVPVAAGLGGGSSDAAAALRLLARLNNLPTKDARLMDAARTTGADIPVCLDPSPRIMRGIGEVLSAPLRLPALHAVLVNPRIPVPTAQVFAALAKRRADAAPLAIDRDEASRLVEAGGNPAFDALVDALTSSSNDLEAPATELFPGIAEAIGALHATRRCRLARMSGSGATCFGLFATADDATEAAARLKREHSGWWVCATILGSAKTVAADVPSPLEGEGV